MLVLRILMIVARARTQQTDKHKLVTHNLGDIGKVRGRVFVRAGAVNVNVGVSTCYW